MTYLLLSLIVIPIGTVLIARKSKPERLWFYTGLSIGAVVAPFCMGIYGLMHFAVVLRAIFYVSMAGFILGLVHGYPAIFIMRILGLLHLRDNFAVFYFIQSCISALVWMSFYGLTGNLIDKRRRQANSE